MIAGRFLLVYFLTAVIDYTAFVLALRLSGNNVLLAQTVGRLFSVPFNYLAVRSRVFQSEVRHDVAGPRFLVLYAAAFFAAWGAIELLEPFMPFARQSIRLVIAKMIAEGSILVVKFFVQRHFIFGVVRKPAST